MQKKMRMRIILLAFIAIAVAIFVNNKSNQTNTLKAPDGNLIIFHSNDVHARVFEDKRGVMGYAKIAGIINNERQGTTPVIYLDAGDAIHGLTFATLTKGESIIQILNAIKLDAMAVGNHEFDYGYDRLLELKKMASFPMLAGNIVRDEKRDFTAYKIIEKDGYKIAVFGLTTPETAYKTHPNNVKNVTFEDPTKKAQKLVNELKGKAHLVVALGHIGVDKASVENTQKILKTVKGIDLFIDGHSHTKIENGEMMGRTLVVQTGEYAKALGKVEVSFKDGKKTLSAKLITQEDAKNIAKDQKIANLIEDINKNVTNIASVVIGKSSVTLNGERELVRTQETNLGNLATNAMLEETGADVALTNGGGIRASINIGDITVQDAISVFPFGNLVVVKEVTGQEIKQAIEHGIRNYPDAEGGFPHVAGMSFTFDPSRNALERVTSLTIAGKPYDAKKTYLLATSDFLAAGGDGYDMFAENKVHGEYSSFDDILIKYIKKHSPISPKIEGRIVAE